MANTSVVACGQIWKATSDIPDDIKTLKLKKDRPYLIVQPDIHNFKIGTYIAMPITTQNEKESIYKIPINCPQGPHRRFIQSWIITFKERILEETDLLEYLGCVSPEVVKECIDKHYSYLKGDCKDFIINPEYEQPPQCNITEVTSTNISKEESSYVITNLNSVDCLESKSKEELINLLEVYKADKKLFMTSLNITSNNYAVKVRDKIQKLLNNN